MQVALNRREHDVWGIVRVPYPDTEDSRQLHRELEVLKEEKKQHCVRVQSCCLRKASASRPVRNF